MKTPLKFTRLNSLNSFHSLKALIFALLLASLSAGAQTAASLASRIGSPIDDAQRVTLAGSRAARSYLAEDVGAVDPSLPLHSVVMDFSLTAAQKDELDALLTAQQDLASPAYHQWLSPEQYGARFGLSGDDLAAIERWLARQGFAIERVARGRNRIVFSGTARQIESAFGAALHRFRSADGSMHYAPAHDLTVPAALASSISAIRNLSDYLPHPRYVKPATRMRPGFTGVNGQDAVNYGVTPGDLAVVYDIGAAYQAGYTGAGQAIAVVGQSYVRASDIARFQTLAGVPSAKAPIFVLVPDTGAPERFEGDETESDVDLEYSSSVAPGAQVYFVYTGSYREGAFYALEYAVDERIAPVVSNSYGACEVEQASGSASAATEIADADAILAQAAAQGQTVISAAGDGGSVDCIAESGQSLATLQSAAVDYPASSPYNTAMGGTEFPLATYTTLASTYWLTDTSGTPPLVASARSYIPEQVWNDDDPVFGTSAGGGGVSLYEAAAAWQTPGTPIGGAAIPVEPTINVGTARKPNNVPPRLVPDISLYASPNDPGFLFCSSDPTLWAAGQTGSCTNGFYDDAGLYLTYAGGTSFDSPIFAGMVAILNQALNSTGQGNLNATLYGLASSSIATYQSVFHDIATGSNACYDFYESEPGYPAPPAPMPSLCGVGPAVSEYAATAGYDLASGLGSVDFYNLLNAWPRPASASLAGTATTLTASTANPAAGAVDSVAIAVASTASTPTGTVSLTVDGSGVSPPLALGGGTATYAFSSSTVGAHVVTATYSGDPTHAASTGTLTLSVAAAAPTFSIAATSLSVAQGAAGTSTVTVTPVGGYTGAVRLRLSAPATLSNACATLGDATVLSASPVAVVLTVYTDSGNCPAGAVPAAEPARARTTPHSGQSASLAAALGGVLLALSRRRRGRPRTGLPLFALAALTLGVLAGCTPGTGPGETGASNGSLSPPGTYVLTVSGVDSLNPTLSSSTTLTLTVQ